MVDPVAMLLHRSDWPGDHPHSYGPCPAQHSGSTPHASNEPTCATSQTEACGQSMSSSTLPATSIVASCIPKKQLSFLGNSCDKTNYFSRLAHPRDCLKCRSQNRTPGTRFVVNTWTSFPSPHRKTWKRRIFLSSFISLLVFASQLSGVSSTSPSPSSSNTDLNLGILVAESTDEDFLSKLQTRVDKAVSDFYNSAEYQDLNPGSSGQDFRVSCSIYQQRDTESVVSNLNNIFSNTTTNAVLSLASYDIHSSFLPLAELYQKAYIPVNAFLPPEAKTHILSLLPTFRQQAQMLSKILDLYKWQTVHVIYSKFHFWQEFSTYFYFDMTSMLFKVTLSRALESPLQTEEADDALDEAKTSKVVVLFLDIDDQLTILARASAKEMTKHHIFFSFPRTPYDPTSLSLLALTPPITGQGRFSADATTQGINIFESVFVVTPTFPPEATVSSANSTDTQSGSRRRRRRRRRRSTEAAGGGTPLYFASGRESHNVVMNKHHGGGDGRRENRLVGKGQVGQGALQTLTYRQRKKDPHLDFPPENSETVSKDSGEKSYKNRDKNCSGENGGKNRNIFLPDITYKTLPSSPMFDRPRSPIHVGKDVEYVVQSDTQAISSINQALSPGVYVPTKRSSENKPFPFAQARNRRPLFEDVKHQIPQFVKGGSSGAVKQSEDSSTLDTSRDKVSHTGSSPQRPNTLLFESEDSSHSVLDTDILEKDKDEPSSPSSSKLRYKREIQKFVASGSDLSAIYDAVYLVSLAALRVASNSSSVPSGEQLIRSVYDQTFPGDLGQFTIDQQQAVLFDFVLYDFNSSSGTFHPRVFYEAVSSSDWLLTEQGAISWPGTIVPGDECYKQMPNCNEGVEISYIIAIVIAAIGIIVIAAVVIVFIRRYWVNKEMTKGPNKVILNSEDLVFILRKDMGKGSRIMKSRATLIDKDNTPDLLRGSADPSRSMASINELSDYTETARYNGDLVHVKELDIKGFEMRSKLLTFVRMLRDLRHENINPYVGFLAEPVRPAIVMEYCSRGSLHDVIHNDDFKLDWDFKLSLLTDLVRGIRYLHSTPLKFHGGLTSKNCVIDSRFVLKVTDYGVSGIMERCKAVKEFEAKDQLWSAPELLRDPMLLQRGSDKGDLYAMAIVFQEVALRTEPYSTTGLTPEEIVKKLKKPPPLIRPSVTPQAAPPQFIQIMKQCWSEMPEMRPSVDDVYDQFKKLTGGKKANIVDTMFKMLEKYSNDLEEIVAERTMQLEEEKKKTDQLLYRMLPATVAENLKLGNTVEAETFSEVSIYFSDIVGFTTISAMSTPMQVVDLLNDLYTMFDATIDNHDVYKVETIGDAYMVVSGLPIRNGIRHAGEIGSMALVLLSQCGKFTIRHMPQVPLRLRIGLHTGSCVAGVVGLTMPRFCLFGDTVNTASRMESTGSAFRIHMSEAFKQLLDVLGGYKIEYRGKTEVKGKGKLNTYWLVGKDGFDKELPEPPPLIGDDSHGLDSIMRSVNNDQLAALNPALGDATAKANSAPDLASADIVDAPVPEGGGTNGPGTLPSSTSHPAHLDELHKGSCSQSGVKNTSIVTADINIVGGAKFDDVGTSNVSKDASATNDSSAGAGPDNSCQSRHSESNDSGFGSERKHSQGNDGGFHASASAGNHSNGGGGGAAGAGGDNKGKRHSQPSSGNTRTTSVVSSSDVTLQNHVMSTVDLGDDVLAPVTEV